MFIVSSVKRFVTSLLNRIFRRGSSDDDGLGFDLPKDDVKDILILWFVNHNIIGIKKVKFTSTHLSWKYKEKVYAIMAKGIVPHRWGNKSVYGVWGTDPHAFDLETGLGIPKDGAERERWEAVADEYYKSHPDIVRMHGGQISRAKHSDYRVYNGNLGTIMERKLVSEYIQMEGIPKWVFFALIGCGIGIGILGAYLLALIAPEQFRALFGIG